MPELLESGHAIITGATNTGKSYLSLYNIVQSLLNNRPCGYIDPKGDTYRILLAFLQSTDQGQELWEAHHDRILFLNPVTTADSILSFNAIAPMEQFAHARVDLIALLANTFTTLVRKQSGFEWAEANRLQNFLSAAIRLLVEGGQGQYTLAELPFIVVPTFQPGKKGGQSQEVYNNFVKSLLQYTSHPGTRSFWEVEWASWTPTARREWTQSAISRIEQYLSDNRLLPTICSIENSTLDFRRIVDEGYWLFVNLPYPLLGDTITTLLGNLIITNILYACMRRSPGSRPYRLILDEAYFFNGSPVDTILETARAYNLWLTLIVQSLDQLCRSREGRMDERLRDTALNNCRYITSFHNVADAKILADIMFPVTGQVVTGIRANDDLEYMPVFSEQNENEWRFKNLRHREMIFYDQLGQDPPRVWRTPDVIMDPPNDDQIRAFEARHLRATGRPIAAIYDEIEKRRDKVKAMFGFVKPPENKGPSGKSEPEGHGRKLNKASYGEWE